MDLVRSIGADDVIDYTSEDFTRSGRRYDLLLDIAGSRPVSACRRVLTPQGNARPHRRAGRPMAAARRSHVLGARDGTVGVAADSPGGHRPCTAKKQNLMTLTTLIEDGKVTPVIDRSYPFDEIPEAVRYQEQGHAPGKVVVTI